VVLYWMQRRGTTRQIFADRMGKSLSWVDKIRAGDRQLDRLSVLRQIASVLGIPLSILIDTAEAERQRTCPDGGEIAAHPGAVGHRPHLDRDPRSWPGDLRAGISCRHR
jgi:transcriptional regulator with XRE-family HTH domain